MWLILILTCDLCCAGSLVSVKEKLSSTENDKKRLTHDNSSLYEKIRYLQNYSQTTKSGQRYSGHIESMESGRANKMQQSMDLSNLEFSNVYEQKLSPVAMFSQLERQKKLKDLTVIERVLLNSTVQSKFINACHIFTVVHCIYL